MTSLDTPQDRRVVVAFSQAKWDSLASEIKRNMAGNPGLAVLIVDGESHLDPDVTQKLLSAYTINGGDVLVQNPYSTSRYFLEEDAAVEIALEKTLCVAEVCHLLGARKFEVNSVQNATDGTEWNAVGGGGAKGIVGKLKANGGRSQQLARKITLADSSSGGAPDVNAAREYLSRHNLESDSMLRSLVDMAAFPGNSIESRSLTIDVSREAKSTLKLALEINAANQAAGTASGGREKRNVDQFTVQYTIEFPNHEPSAPDHDRSSKL
jgi:hypothetical protein